VDSPPPAGVRASQGMRLPTPLASPVVSDVPSQLLGLAAESNRIRPSRSALGAALIAQAKKPGVDVTPPAKGSPLGGRQAMLRPTSVCVRERPAAGASVTSAVPPHAGPVATSI